MVELNQGRYIKLFLRDEINEEYVTCEMRFFLSEYLTLIAPHPRVKLVNLAFLHPIK